MDSHNCLALGLQLPDTVTPGVTERWKARSLIRDHRGPDALELWTRNPKSSTQSWLSPGDLGK